MTLMSLLSPLIAATDIELLHYLNDKCMLQKILPLLDDFFTRGTSLQASSDDIKDDSESRELSSSSCAVFSLVFRLVDAPQLLQLAIDCGLLHVTRLVPFCQLYSVKNSDAVGELLAVIYDNVAEFSATLLQLQQLYFQQLQTLQVTVERLQRHDVTNQIRYCRELSISLCGMTAARSVLHVLILGGYQLELAVQTQSVLSGLVQLYEIVLPRLQTQLTTFDDKAVPHEILIIAETRWTLLLLLGRCIDAVMSKPIATGKSEEELLAGLHALTTGCVAEDAEQGSYLSDLWYFCGYKNHVTAFFERHKFDTEILSYLMMVIEQLPRRQTIPMMQSHDLADDLTANSVQSVDAKHENESKNPLGEEMDLLPMVQQVKEFFPHLGDGYIELCLLSSNCHVEGVINFLLESNPPPMLIDVPQDLSNSDASFVRLRAQIHDNLTSTPKAEEESKLDPTRVWVGKRKMEKTYDPQIKKKDEKLVEKVKQLVAMYEEEDNFALSSDERLIGNEDGNQTLDEYDDDYNDEFDDYVPFSVRDGGNLDDQDAIREQNRRIRAKEEKDAFWEGIKNRNREIVGEADENEVEEEKDNRIEEKVSHFFPKNSGQNTSGKTDKFACRNEKMQGEKSNEALTPQQMHRQRARKDKNKAKIANHNRKDRAMKKMG
ncbi:putative ubiquitin system component Cue, UBA-like superfamily [Plasmopara halstedii]